VPDLIYTYPEKPSFTMTNLKKFLTIDDIKLPSSENAGAAIMIIVNKYYEQFRLLRYNFFYKLTLILLNNSN